MESFKDFRKRFFRYQTSPHEECLMQALFHLHEGTAELKGKRIDQIYDFIAEKIGQKTSQISNQKWKSKKIEEPERQRRK